MESDGVFADREAIEDLAYNREATTIRATFVLEQVANPDSPKASPRHWVALSVLMELPLSHCNNTKRKMTKSVAESRLGGGCVDTDSAL